jgi:predicted TIM-barrel fold metal-dependent hydrolase
MIIDINMHALPEELFTNRTMLESYIRIVPRAYGEYAHLDTMPGTGEEQIVIEKPKGYPNLNFSKNAVDVSARLEIMSQAGLDKAILRTPCWQEWFDLEMCRHVNDCMSQLVEQNPDKFLAVATVPPWGDKGCIDEVERCIHKLGFVGVELASHYGTLYLDDESFRPYFKKLNELNVPIVVHHTPLPVQYDSIYHYANVRRSIGRCVEQLIAVNREIFSGLFEECPNLKMIHTMLGGAFFAYTDQIAIRKSGEREEHERFDESTKIRNYLEKNIFFDISTPVAWSKAQLECAIQTMGADHILYGSSYPIRMDWVLNGVKHIESLAITDEEKDLIFCANAQRLFNIK